MLAVRRTHLHKVEEVTIVVVKLQVQKFVSRTFRSYKSCLSSTTEWFTNSFPVSSTLLRCASIAVECGLGLIQFNSLNLQSRKSISTSMRTQDSMQIRDRYVVFHMHLVLCFCFALSLVMTVLQTTCNFLVLLRFLPNLHRTFPPTTITSSQAQSM